MKNAQYDPQSLLTVGEAASGLTYLNSYREFPNRETYEEALSGQLNHDQIVELAPRRKREA